MRTKALRPMLLCIMAASCKPATTDVSDSDIDDTDGVDTDIADTDVVDTDVVDTDIADTDVVDTAPPDTDVVDTDPPGTDVIDTDPPDTDVVDTDPPDTDVTSALVPDILSDTLYMNCMPSVPPDPVGGGFVVRYQNDGSTADHAAFASATLTIHRTPLTSSTWTFDVNPTDSGSVPPGQHSDITHAKVYGSGSGSTNDPCDYCGGTWTLDVSWQIDGATVTDSLDAGSVDCVY